MLSYQEAAMPFSRSPQRETEPAAGSRPAVLGEEEQSSAWEAVRRRDRSVRDFVYAVTTTGVFCRCGCPSRQPARENVRFFADAEAAQRAGFRACRRCRPTSETTEAALVRKLTAYLDRHIERAVTLDELGRLASCSPFTAQRVFRRVVGLSPSQYQRQARATVLRSELTAGNGTATDAVYAAGYSGSSRVYEAAHHALGMRPGQFRRKGDGVNIRYSIGKSPLGLVLVARTEKGVCMVALGESREVLLEDLQHRFKAAEIVEDPGDSETLAAVVAYCGGESGPLDALPLDLRATAFQMRVWEALRRIPAGETRSYSEVAAALGNPKAVRAVARACASNPAALLVPCHRVVGSDGKLTGYRWGIERKRQLLAMELGSLSGKAKPEKTPQD